MQFHEGNQSRSIGLNKIFSVQDLRIDARCAIFYIVKEIEKRMQKKEEERVCEV